MKNISDFLGKFQIIISSDDDLKESIILAIKNTIGIVLNKKDLKVLGDTVFIKTSPVIKNEIFLKKEKIIKKINEIPRKRKIRDLK